MLLLLLLLLVLLMRAQSWKIEEAWPAAPSAICYSLDLPQTMAIHYDSCSIPNECSSNRRATIAYRP
jgi:hypothetical protein